MKGTKRTARAGLLKRTNRLQKAVRRFAQSLQLRSKLQRGLSLLFIYALVIASLARIDADITQVQAQTIECSSATLPDRIFQKCQLGARSVEKALEDQAIDDVLTIHQLPVTERSQVLLTARAEIRARIFAHLIELIQKESPTADEQIALANIAARIKQKRVDATSYAIASYNVWKAFPCSFIPPAPLTYDPGPACSNPLANAFAGPIAPTLEEFQEMGVLRSETDLATVGAQLVASESARNITVYTGTAATGIGGAIGAKLGTRLPQGVIKAVFPYILEELSSSAAKKSGVALSKTTAFVRKGGQEVAEQAIEKTAQRAGVAASDAFLGELALGGPVTIIIEAITTAVTRAIDVVNEDQLPDKLAAAKTDAQNAAPPDLKQLINDEHGTQELYGRFIQMTLPEVFDDTIPPPTSNDHQFTITDPLDNSQNVGPTISYLDWNGKCHTARQSGRWFVDKDEQGFETLTLTINYQDWHGGTWMASRSGAQFILTNPGAPDSTRVVDAIKYLDCAHQPRVATIKFEDLIVTANPVVRVGCLDFLPENGEGVVLGAVAGSGEAPASLAVTVNDQASATVNGITVRYLYVNDQYQVLANVVSTGAAPPTSADFTFKVTNSLNQTASAPFTILKTTVPDPSSPFALPSAIEREAEVGTPYLAQLHLISPGGGCHVHSTFAITNGTLPPGISLDVNEDLLIPNGLIEGTPTSGGDFYFTVNENYENGEVASRDYEIHVKSDIAAVPDGMVSWWPGEGNAADVNNLHNGSIIGNVGFDIGLVNNAFKFDGTNGYISLPSDTFTLTQDFSFELWFKTATRGVIIGQQYSAEPYNPPGLSTPGIYVATDGKLHVDLFRNNGGNGAPTTVSANRVDNNAFHHVAVVYRKAAQTEEVYLDGALINTVSSFFQSYYPNQVFQLGTGYVNHGPDSGWINFNGLIDEPTLYNRALTANEIKTIVMAGGAGKLLLNPIVIPPSVRDGNDGGILIKVLGGTGSHQYSKDNGATFQETSSFANLSPGAYTIVVKDADDRIIRRVVTIDNPLPELSLTTVAKNPICYVTPDQTQTGQLFLNVTGQTGALLYSIDNGQHTQSSQSFTSLAPGIYTPWAKDPTGAVVTGDPVMLTLPPQLKVFPNTIPDAVAGQFYSQNFTSTGGTGSRHMSATQLPASLTADFTANGILIHGFPHEAGDYQFLINVTDANSCGITQPLTIHVAAPSCATAPDDITSWWRAEGDAVDSFGPNNGTLNGSAGFATGRVGQAFKFDGANGYVALPDNLFPYPATGTGNAPFTFELWFKTVSGGVILGQQDVAPYQTIHGAVPAIYVGTDGHLRVEMFWKGSVSFLTSKPVINDDKFHHVAVVYDGTTETVYLDGTVMGSGTRSQTAYAANYKYQLGTGYAGSGRPATNGGWFNFNGLIDEPTLYNRALTPSEVQAVFGGNVNGKCFSKGATTTTIDSVTPLSSVVGEPLFVKYTVKATAAGRGTPTGNVTVSDGTNSCTGTVADGGCSIVLTSPGLHIGNASYAGDANYSGSTSLNGSYLVAKANTTTQIISHTPETTSAGQNVTVTFAVGVNAPGTGTPTGDVTISDGTTSCTVAVAAGQCTLALSNIGSHTLTATYAGDANFNGSTSAGIQQTVCGGKMVVTSKADSGAGSLRQALQDACPGATITFDQGVTGTISLASEMVINKDVTIQGPGANVLTISGNDAARVFRLQSGTTAAISGLTISNGKAGANTAGGGIANAGTLTLISSAISNNTAQSGGGVQSSGTLTVINSTISNNSATHAGGIEIVGGNAAIINSTISSNSAGADAGGLEISVGVATLTNVTLTGNRSDSDQDNSGTGGGVKVTGGGVLALRNTVVAGNYKGSGTLTVDDINGPVDSSSSFNLIGAGGSGGLTDGTNNNQVGVVDAQLGMLADNGGPTRTHLPLPGSPAIDKGDNSKALDQNNAALTMDQRGTGFMRMTNEVVDVGAVEVNYSNTATEGTPQSAAVNAAFATQLKATVKESGILKSNVPVTFTAPATGASGTFAGGGTSITVNTDAQGVATAPAFTANGTVGGYNVTASLSAGQPVSTFSLTNNALTTATALTSSANPSDFGELVTFKATVTSAVGTPTGTVQFQIDGVNAGTPIALTGGVATYNTSALSVGNHTVAVTYDGDTIYLLSGANLAGGQQVVNAAPGIQLSASSYSVSEDGTDAVLTVNRTGDTSAAATVDYATSDASGLTPCSTANGLASQRCDYAASVGTLRFAAGETSKTIFIPVVDDSYVEGVETFTLTLSNPTGGSLGDVSAATVTINDNEAANGPNPIPGAAFFVRQQYIDFLGRDPDPAGFQGWQNILNNCPASGRDAQGNFCDRVEVSAGFFRSAEFQARGYFIYRFYAASLGRIPHYGEFVPDLGRVSGFLTDAQLEANKVAFVQEFMSRQEFRTKYDMTLNDPAAYVNLLESTAGVTLSNKQALMTGLQNSTETRATVLRKVIESSEVATKFFNEAFVVEAYFGYLRRDPDAAYVQWVQIMNQTGDYRTLISGFINSNEYVQRFGP